MTTFDDWYQQYIYETVLNDVDGNITQSLSPSSEFFQLAFKPILPMEDQCINPSILQLPANSGLLEEHNMQSEEGGASSSSPSCLASSSTSASSPDTTEPMNTNIENSEASNFSSLCSIPSSSSSTQRSSVITLSPELNDDIFYVEQIIQGWGPKDSRQYLIKWVGWGPEYNTWEPAQNVSEDLIMELEERPRRTRCRQG
ncbi:hypothetical protein J7T55_006940 [Diaporthe amygdali]|uniref:uncharacterized protein n=1 Tax=Phomopsis amygdali TaxID=1214568 RepID=UPI0022FDE5D5|nr:uncharacterized protein J7T55_006940 [Diaporthe amygdali]KAJ0107062.1 hypothetical protein J7T55_006940 [Diaporthe amygdali]